MPIKPATMKTAVYIVNRMIASGHLSDVQSFSVVGNDVQESLLKPSIVGDKMLKDNAHGLGQWRGSRFEDLQAFAEARGKPWTDLDTQIDFQLAEIIGEVGTEKSHGNRLRKAKGIEAATKAAIGLFRPRGYSLATPEAGHGYSNRLRNAKEIEAHFKTLIPASPVAPSTPNPFPAPNPPLLPVPTLGSLIPPMVRLGSSGPAVAALQLALIGEGYKLQNPPTGYFGPGTDTVVRDYQRSRGLGVDGEVGKETVTALLTKKPTIYLPSLPSNTDKPLWLIDAQSHIGLKEYAGAKDNPDILAWAKSEGGSVAKNYKNDSTAWCALFANHCLTRAGLVGTETLWALDFNDYKTAKNNGWPHVKLSGPAVGCFIPMKREGGGHIAIVVGRTKDGMLAAIGGNQSDMVSVNSFPRTRPLSYCWPAGVTLPTLIGFNYLPLVNSAGVAIKES